ncbi:leucine--tRNA ligase [Candidatus Micrarchaeota archaeon]|nr:leucine--tRNA ligase [Candidatus Micrarchaeota archaeon]
MEIDMRTVHLKWQKEWAENNVYQADAEQGGEKKFIAPAFPYPNSPQHIGHGRTYTIADIYARYLRMKGYNVLFPMAFHVTGTPIVSMAKKLREKDEEILDIFERIYGIDREKAESLVKPVDLVMYFSNEIEHGMREIGYSIDWRRKFYTFDEHFNKFIEWQFFKLKDLGYLKMGEHPVPWCPSDNNAMSAHDTKGDVDPELEEVTAIKFGFEDGSIILSTYRPETIFGVTNLWINPKAVYVKAKYKNEFLYLAEEAAKDLALQLGLEIVEKIPAEKILGKNAKSTLGNEVPILPAEFVNPGEGTGAVMSVPAHAPFDYLALRDLGKVDELGLIKVIEIKGYEIPAKDVVERMNIENQSDPKAEEATKEVYRKEVNEGKMCIPDSEYTGMNVDKARELIKRMLEEKGGCMRLHIIANGPAYCRCGTRVVVNNVKNQWFIDYGNPKWKEDAKECIAQMELLPERTRADYLYTVDWLREKACTRAQGLGTPFPFEKSQIIESLSDSTIYMAYYTIAHMARELAPDTLDEKFFDYVYHGKGEGSPEAKKMRESFLYWYPLDSRNSGADLIRNHLTFFIFNHVAIFPKEQWPRRIVANGFVLMEGKKMSKSMGNILPLRNAVKEYGADIVRLSITGGADLDVDTDFSREIANGIASRVGTIMKLVDYSKEEASERIDLWLLSKLNRRLAEIDSKYENLECRQIVKDLLYDTCMDISWYLKRSRKPRLKEFFNIWTRAIAPFAPHFAEEIWHVMGNSSFVVNERMAQAESSFVDEGVEKREALLEKTLQDIDRISALLKTRPKKVTLIVADAWKNNAYSIAKEEKNFEKALKRCMAEPELKDKGAAIVQFIKQLGKNIFALEDVLGFEEEYALLSEAEEFIKEQTGAEISVIMEKDATHTKAKNASPGKPAIVLE